MDLVTGAISNFQSLGFGTTYISKVLPIRDERQIKLIKKELVGAEFKERAFLEAELEEQIVGIEEEIVACQFFDSFKGFRWSEEKELPAISGRFKVKNATYNLSFLARFPEIIEDAERAYIHLGINVGSSNIRDPKEQAHMDILIGQALKNAMRQYKMPASVKFERGILRIMPTFILHTQSQDLGLAYNNLIEAMANVGYKEGNIYKGRVDNSSLI